MFRSLTFVAAAVAAAGLAALGGTEPASAPLQPKDPFPKGCVSCHAKVPDGDHRLNAGISNIKGHPGLGAVKTVPGDCMKCHKPSAKKPTFAQAIHKAHYGKGAASNFNKLFKGECTHCHDLDAKTGTMTVKSGTKNW